MIEGLNKRKISDYRIESDRAFREMANNIGNEQEVYFQLVNDGCYQLIPKWYPK